MKILIKSGIEQTFELEVSEENTISNIKLMIQNLTGISPDKQRLTHNERILEDYWTLDPYSITKNKTLHLSVIFSTDIEIKIETLLGKLIRMKVSPQDSFSHIKKWLEYSIGYPSFQQELIYKKKNIRDEEYLSDYGIKNQSTLVLRIKERSAIVFVEDEIGGKISVGVEIWDRIYTLKVKIRDELMIPPEKQVLLFGNKEIKDEKRLVDYNIKTQDTIHLKQISY